MGSMSEKDLQAAVIGAARVLGWRHYHTFDSRRSEPGFPDLVLVHPEHGVLFVELKAATGKVTTHQELWLASLRAAGARAVVWRPHHWQDGVIERVLRGVVQ